MKHKRDTRYKRRATNQAALVIALSLVWLFGLQAQAMAEPPVALDASYKVIKDTQNSTLNRLTLRAYDPDGDPLTYYILDLPGHGVLRDIETGNPIEPGPLDSNIVKYIPEPDYKGPDSFTFKVKETEGEKKESNTATASLDIVNWFAPIGIPDVDKEGNPIFGINETHMMYAGIDSETGDYYKYNFVLDPSRGEEYYPDAGNGPYTHYVDNQHENATDIDNPYGTPGKPRKKLPRQLPEGSVVEIHNGYPHDYERLNWVGTEKKPIFIRGIGKPRYVNKMSLYGNENCYVIVEGLNIYKLGMYSPGHHISFRNNDINGDAEGGGTWISSNDGNTPEHIVIYNNLIHDNGDWLLGTPGHPCGGPGEPPCDQDVHGITINNRAANIWIVDNEMYHNSGDGLQIDAGSKESMPYVNHIYVGRNISHHNKQAGLWTKRAVDVIFSKNAVYAHRPIGKEPSCFGVGIGFQAGPENIWLLFNHIYDCSYGIQANSTSGLGYGKHSYFIGNLIHDIHHDPNYKYNPNDSWSNAGIMLVGVPERYIVNNTIYNVDAGINGPGTGFYHMVNNIIINVTEPEANHIFIGEKKTTENSIMRYNLLYQNGDDVRIRWGSSRIYNLDPDSPDYFRHPNNYPDQGEGCLDADPLFINAEANNFHLQTKDGGYPENSPALDAGILDQVYAKFEELYGIDIRFDFDGNPRPQPYPDGEYDIGAYEYSPSGFRYGDVNGDGKVNHNDASLVLRYRVGKVELTPEQKQAADVSGNGEVTEFDAYLIGEYQVGNIECFPVEEGCGE